tara:strand:- start:213 stop:1400 length:1188 start_codon:yes stop_codon:yes gene_type:complete
MGLIKKEFFYISLTQDNTYLPYYLNLKNNINGTLFYVSKENEGLEHFPVKGTSISLFPSYLHPNFFNEHLLNIVKIPQKKINGYAIKIDGTGDIKKFIQKQYKKKFKDNIYRLLLKFENRFTPVYKFYFGEIPAKEYTFLMEKLQEMLTTRFNQRGATAQALQSWDYYKNTTYGLINSKKASLFVIYANGEPVQISLNHHHKDIMFISIPSYDINLSKFSLGNISIYKLLEWAIKNQYTLLDMAYGDLEYKRRWSNYVYSFEHHILYPKNKLFAAFLAYIEAAIIRLKNGLKSKGLDVYIKKLAAITKRKPNANETPEYRLSKITEMPPKGFMPVDLKKEDCSWLKKAVYDFLYFNEEHINDIEIYKMPNREKVYLIKGKNIMNTVGLTGNTTQL